METFFNTVADRQANKPSYSVFGFGTIVLFDMANLIGVIGPMHAWQRIGRIRAALFAQGYRATFVWEWRAFRWAVSHQETEEDALALEHYVQTSGAVSMVGKEADLPLLQIARANPRVVVLTNDRLDDYMAVYGDIVRAERVQGFSCASLDGGLYLCIDGLERAIELDAPTERSQTEIVARGMQLYQKGQLQRAIRLFSRAARAGNPAGFDGLALVHAAGEDAVSEHKSRRCAAQSLRLACKERDTERRRARAWRKRFRRNGMEG